MVLGEIFEHGVSMVKTVWRKRGNKIARQNVERLIVTDVHPRSHIEIKDSDDVEDES